MGTRKRARAGLPLIALLSFPAQGAILCGIVMLAPEATLGAERQASLFGPTIHDARPTDVEAQRALLLGVRDHLRQADARLRSLADFTREEEKLETLLSHLAARKKIPEEYLDSALRQFDRREQATLDALGREYQRAVFLAFPRDASVRDRHLAVASELQEDWSRAGSDPSQRPRIAAWLLEAIEAVRQRPTEDPPPLPTFGPSIMDDLDAYSARPSISREVGRLSRAAPPRPCPTCVRERRTAGSALLAFARPATRLRSVPQGDVSTPSGQLPVPSHARRRVPSAISIPHPDPGGSTSSHVPLQHGLLAMPPLAGEVPDLPPFSRPISPLPTQFRGRLPAGPGRLSTVDEAPRAIPSVNASFPHRKPATRPLPTPPRLDAQIAKIAQTTISQPTATATPPIRGSVAPEATALANGDVPSVPARCRIVPRPSCLSLHVEGMPRPGHECWFARTNMPVAERLPAEAIRPRRIVGPPEPRQVTAAGLPCFTRQGMDTPQLSLSTPPRREPFSTTPSHAQPGVRRGRLPTLPDSSPKPRWTRDENQAATRSRFASLARTAMPAITVRPPLQPTVLLAARCTTEELGRERTTRRSDDARTRRRLSESSSGEMGKVSLPDAIVAFAPLSGVTPEPVGRVPSQAPPARVRHTIRVDPNPLEPRLVSPAWEPAPIRRAVSLCRLPGVAFANAADLHIPNPADQIDLEQLRSRIAGCNLEIAELEEEMNAPVPWTIERLAALISRLQLLSARHGDLVLLYAILPPDRRVGMEPVEPIDAIVKRLSSGVAAAREAARCGLRSSARSDPTADLMILQELSRVLTALAER